MPKPFHLLAFATSFAMVGICTGLALGAGSTPITVVTLRTLGTVTLFFLYFRLSGVTLAMPRRDRAIAFAIGIPLCMNNYMLNAAMGVIPVPLVVLIFYLWPAITTAVSWLLGRERFRWRGLAGLVLAFSGLALALNVDFSRTEMHGVMLAVGGSLAWSVTYLLMSQFFHGRDTRAPTLMMTLTAAVAFVTLCLVTRDVALPAGPKGWAAVIGVPFFYAFAMIGLFAASAKLGPAAAGFYMNFEPLAALVLAWLILDQTLAPVQLAGGALVISALFLFRPPPAAGAQRRS